MTIATAIVFCHRFFHRQSHKKNDRYVSVCATLLYLGNGMVWTKFAGKFGAVV